MRRCTGCSRTSTKYVKLAVTIFIRSQPGALLPTHQAMERREGDSARQSNSVPSIAQNDCTVINRTN
jgi:hypothetical protein